MSGGDGVRAIGAALVDAVEAARAPEAQQLSMLPTRFAPGDARADRARQAVRSSQAGRPPGSRNIATRQALDFIRRVIGDPAIERSRWLLHTPETLAAELGCSKLEAFDRLDAIRESLQRLYYAPLAPVDDQGNAVVPRFDLTIGGAGGPQKPDAAPWDYLDLLAQKPQQNQALPQSADDVSHDDVSHDEAK